MEIQGGKKRKWLDEMSEFKTFPNDIIRPPCFYKLIVAPSSQSHKLRIPEEYVKRHYEEQLAKDYVKLRVGDGRVWKVEVFKDESGKVWLTKGWDKIVINYRMKYGSFVLFNYDQGDSEFHVTIFDTTGFEIDYDDQPPHKCVKLDAGIIEISSNAEDEDEDNDDDDGFISPEEEDDVVDHEKRIRVTQRLNDFQSQNPQFTVVMHYWNVFFNSKNRPPQLVREAMQA